MNNKHETLAEIQERAMAAELIRRRLRIGFVRFVLTRIYQTDLRRIWRELHPGEPTPSGCLPGSSISVIKTPMESAFAAAMLGKYQDKLTLVRSPSNREIDPITLCATWDAVVRSFGDRRPPSCDFNLLYLLAREYRACQVELTECNRCHALHLQHTRWVAHSRRRKCPHCELEALARAQALKTGQCQAAI